MVCITILWYACILFPCFINVYYFFYVFVFIFVSSALPSQYLSQNCTILVNVPTSFLFVSCLFSLQLLVDRNNFQLFRNLNTYALLFYTVFDKTLAVEYASVSFVDELKRCAVLSKEIRCYCLFFLFTTR